PVAEVSRSATLERELTLMARLGRDRWIVALIVGMALGAAGSAAGEDAGPPRSKKLIEFGWDEPDTAFLRRHIAQMEQAPFDGCVFHVVARNADGHEEPFLWQAWGRRAFTAAELKPALDDLKATPFRRFRHNFLRFNTTPADIDWFDDFSAVLNNARLAARIAREGRCAGILFDDEEYQGPLFTYPKLRGASRRSFEVYSAQVRQRGREVMDAFQQEFPGLTILLTFGH